MVPPDAGLFILNRQIMYEKKAPQIKSPDITKLKEVVIDHKTKIYIPVDADVEEARSRYLNRAAARRIR